jgi:peptidoglycan DL-endopeptidase CwlO
VPTNPVSLRSALTRRAAVVAGSAAAAALFATVPAPPAAAPALPAMSSTAVVATPVATPVVRLAATKPAAITLNLQAVAAAAPAAVRTSAMHKALGKVGSPYRYGAAGPNAFDCSGLVNWAYKGSGKSLPRSSGALSRIGTPVSKSALQPGDLVFFYKPVSHVGIYVGNGKIVHASNRKSPVKVSDMSRMKFNSARRV